MKLLLIVEFLNPRISTTPTDEYPDPDVGYSQDNNAIPFIYSKLPEYGGLACGDEGSTHADVIVALDIDYGRDLFRYQRQFEKGDQALFGRVATIDYQDEATHVVTFWNVSIEAYKQLLVDCLSALSDKGLINTDTMVATPFFVEQFGAAVSFFANNQDQSQELSPEQLARLDMQRELHLMRPEAKKLAAQKLGLNLASKKSDHQTQAELAGMVTPGQKWWAPTSESNPSTGYYI